MATAPATMRALVQPRPGAELSLDERPTPAPRAGEVLIRVAAAPINPNDLLFLEDRYEIKKARPVVPGFEGSGTVVSAGPGLIARSFVGRRVAFLAGEGDGSWAEYAVAPAMRCVPLRRALSLEEGATMLTNPLTAWVLVGAAVREGHRAVVLTAAAGALGLMVAGLLQRRGLPPLCIVRRAEQAAVLRQRGIADVLDSSAPGFVDDLRARAEALGATLLLDAVAGETTGRVLAAMPTGSIARVYGVLSASPCQIDPDELIFRGKRVEGFTMYDWARTTSLPQQLVAVARVQGLVGDVLATRIQERFPLDQHGLALATMKTGSREGKLLFVA
jgi:NADPH:quinone reductase